MKRTFLLLLFAVICIEGFSQKVRLGIRFAPGFSFNRVNEDNDSLTYKGKGAGVRFFAGPEINFVLGENYVFTTGIWYNTRRTSIIIKDYYMNDVTQEVYNLQYLQLPATLKLYTNDIAVDTKLYFQLGGTFDIRLQEKELKANPYNPYINRFNRFDASMLVGSGLQLQMGANTYIFGGISYMRGLLNSITRTFPIIANGTITGEKVQVKNDLISLDLGLRF